MRVQSERYTETVPSDQAVGKLVVYAETEDEADFLSYTTECIRAWMTNRAEFEKKDTPLVEASGCT